MTTNHSTPGLEMKLPVRLVYWAEAILIGSTLYLLYVLLYDDGRVRADELSQFKFEVQRTSYRIPLLNLSGPGCNDRPCLDYLSKEERVQYHSCYNKTVDEKVARKFGPIHPGKCTFQNSSLRYPVGLGSFQGSGNTWLRGLLEKVTGICSGSRYCDGALRTNGFTGEGVYGPSVIAIKFHTVNPLFTNMQKLPRRISTAVPVFGAALVLIRNPRNAMIAEWHRERTKRQSNRNVSNHFLYVGRESFGHNPDWKEYVIRMTDRWKRHISGWLLNGRNNPLHMVKYENLKINKSLEILNILKFYGETNVSLRSIDLKLGFGYNKFYRNHTDSFDHYTSDQERYISNTVINTINILKEHYDTNSVVIQILNSYV